MLLSNCAPAAFPVDQGLGQGNSLFAAPLFGPKCLQLTEGVSPGAVGLELIVGVGSVLAYVIVVC